MISKYSNFTESSNSSSFSTIKSQHYFHHLNTLQNSNINYLYPSPIQYNSPYIQYPSFHSNLGFVGNQIISPNYYSHKTISYNNNNNFIHAEPVPIDDDLKRKNKCCSHGCNSYISDILYLLKEMKGLKLDEKIDMKNQEESEDSDDTKKNNTKKSKKKGKNKKRKENKEEKARKIQTLKWWKLARDFINIYSFFSIAKKYSIQYSRIRNNLIELRTHSIEEEILLLKEWILTLEESCWEEFEIFIEENCAFQKDDTKNKIRKESLKIIGVIKKYVEYIITGSSKLSKIPERIQQIIYQFIKDEAYFPKKYLTTFQICRLNFEFYGATKNLTDEQSAMILAFLLLSIIASQSILCNIRETVKQFKNYVNVIISSRYVASILHYLTKETFKKDVESLDDIFSLFNYYRNYHLDNEYIEKEEYKDISKDDYCFEGLPNIDQDEYSTFFVNEEEISSFFTTNISFVDTFKNYIFIWAQKLAKLIKEKFSKKDPTLLPRKQLIKPKDKIFNAEEVEEDNKDKNNEENEKKNKKKKKDKKQNKN